MGISVDVRRHANVQEKVSILLAAGRKVRLGGQAGLSAAGAFFPPTLLYCPQLDEAPTVHAAEAFGPAATLMSVRNQRHALQLTCAGGGSLAGTLVTADPQIARQFTVNAAHTHGQTQILNEESIKESTGYGSPLSQLVHGGSGRTGSSEELGSLRAVKHYIQRTAVQGSPTMLAATSKQWVYGARVEEDHIHPFRKCSEELQLGDNLLTPRCTMTEIDIVNFACLGDDHFYAHMDKITAVESIFGECVIHGYFMFSAAAGLSVDAGVGLVIANYGLENSRSIKPVKPGGAVQVRLTCRCKTLEKQRSAEERPTGVVEQAVEVFNQHQTPMALYSILALVTRQHGDFVD